LPQRSFNCLQQFHISGRLLDLCTGGPLPAVSNSGTPAHRRASRAVRRTDVMAGAIAASASTIAIASVVSKGRPIAVLVIHLFHKHSLRSTTSLSPPTFSAVRPSNSAATTIINGRYSIFPKWPVGIIVIWPIHMRRAPIIKRCVVQHEVRFMHDGVDPRRCSDGLSARWGARYQHRRNSRARYEVSHGRTSITFAEGLPCAGHSHSRLAPG
jgi:hypothetical protein